MSQALQISSAAAACPESIGLIVDGAHYSFASLARKVSETPRHQRVLRAQHDLETLLHIYAALEEHRPLCIVPAQTSDEQMHQIAERVAMLPDGIALVLFTSGSRGQAKGVMLSRDAILASARASAKRHGWAAHDRWLCPLPLHHIGGLSVILRCLVDRKTAVLSQSFEPVEVARLIDAEAITQVSLVPTMLWRLLQLGHKAPPTLRLVLVGGAALEAKLHRRALEANYPVVHSYGMTETASQIIVMGRPLDGVELRVVDGCLQVRAPMLLSGYLRPHESEELLEQGWFKTNDRARIDADNSVTILGRSDEIIISGGENIDPRQVQMGIDACKGVRASLVLGLPHPEWGQQLVALIEGFQPVDIEALAGAIRNRLSGHLRPKLLIPVDELPTLENGKLDLEKAHEIATSWREKQGG